MNKESIETKGFNLLVPFSVKADPEAADGETLHLEGIANFCGDLENTSAIEVDLAGEVVVPTGMDISIYKGNPQILWQHNRDYTCGACDKITKKKDGIYIEATIHKGAMEDEDWYRVKSGLITRFSVGFRCKGGEFKEINGKSVYFITKSLLLEISLVSIPASSSSSFHVVKSLGEDTGIYSGDLIDKSEASTEIEATANTTPIKEKKMTTITVKEMDLLNAEGIERLKSLGLEAKLEETVEVNLKAYVDSIVQVKLDAFKAELAQETATPVEESPEAEVAPEEAAAEIEEETVEEAEPEVTEEEAAKAEEASEEDVAKFKELTETINQLKALVAETE